MDRAKDLHVKQNEQVSERKMLHILYNMHNLKLLQECASGTFEVEFTGKGIENTNIMKG
jgi:hypothetical protein